MDTIKQQLDELRHEIKEAKDEKTKALTAGQVSLAEKVQDEIIILQRRLEEKEKQGESQPPESRKFCPRMAK